MCVHASWNCSSTILLASPRGKSVHSSGLDKRATATLHGMVKASLIGHPRAGLYNRDMAPPGVPAAAEHSALAQARAFLRALLQDGLCSQTRLPKPSRRQGWPGPP